MNVGIQSATAPQNKCPYRSLWFEVICHAYWRALVGESGAVIFFTAKQGRFSELCVLLDLDEQIWREQVLMNINERRKSNGRQEEHLA